MNYLVDKNWWMAAGTRAIKTFFQTVVATIGAESVGIVDVDWIGIASVAGLAAIVSICTSLAGLPEVEEDEEV